MAWVHFRDMFTGGFQKTAWEHIYIETKTSEDEELAISEASERFFNRFNTDPFKVTCSCCGYDYHAELIERPRFERTAHFPVDIPQIRLNAPPVGTPCQLCGEGAAPNEGSVETYIDPQDMHTRVYMHRGCFKRYQGDSKDNSGGKTIIINIS